MLYHIEMHNGQQGKTVTVRADRLGDAQDAAMRANPGFSLTGRVRAQEEQPAQEPEVIEPNEDE